MQSTEDSYGTLYVLRALCVYVLCVWYCFGWVQVAIQSALACCRILMVVLMVATTLTAYDPNKHDFPDQSGQSSPSEICLSYHTPRGLESATIRENSWPHSFKSPRLFLLLALHLGRIGSTHLLSVCGRCHWHPRL
jgi:hypothetical protein